MTEEEYMEKLKGKHLGTITIELWENAKPEFTFSGVLPHRPVGRAGAMLSREYHAFLTKTRRLGAKTDE